MNWGPLDFVLAFALLAGVVIIYRLVTRSVTSNMPRIALFAVVVAVVLLVWAEIAVGIFGTPFSGD